MLLLAGCYPALPWKPLPPVPQTPPSPEKLLIRMDPDHVFTDHATGKRYEVWPSQEGKFIDYFVVVQDPGGSPRSATLPEFEFAVSVVMAEWERLGFKEKVEALRHAADVERQTTFMDLQGRIRFKEQAVNELRREQTDLTAHVQAAETTNTFKENLDFYRKKLAEVEQTLALEEWRLNMLHDKFKARFGMGGSQ